MNNILLTIWIMSYFIFPTIHAVTPKRLLEKPIVVVIPSYNNTKWLQSNIDSILSQEYSNFRVIYINDQSTDETGSDVEKLLVKNGINYQVINFNENARSTIPERTLYFAELINKDPKFFTLVNNTQRCGALENLYRAIHSCENHEIIATVDGDDSLYHNQVFKQLNNVYLRKNVWFTHGCLIEHPYGNITWCEPVPKDIIKKNAFREFKCPSHLRTFYSWIFKKIKLEDLLYEGRFFPMAWDMAIMYPICEMAGKRHAYIQEVNYIYNMQNSLNDNKVDPDLQNHLDQLIRSKARYEKLEKKPYEHLISH